MKSWISYKFILLVLSFVMVSSFLVSANDIRISDVRLVPAEEAAPDKIAFNLAWENSWRNPISTGINNWDAAWVFIKYREVGNTGAAWSHLYLSNSAGDYATGIWNGDGAGGIVIEPGLVDARVDANGDLLTAHTPALSGNTVGRNPVVGAFVYRENPGRGRFEVEDIAFAFSLSENGLDSGKLYDFKVFAIEMVYVPQGSFFAGSGGNEEGRFKDGTTENPFRINAAWNAPNTSGGRRIGNEDGQLWGSSTLGNSSIGPTSDATPLDDSWPTGFSGFYSMKYETTQQQYVDFLNTLTRTQQEARFSSTTVGNFMHSGSNQTTPERRNGVRLMSDPGGTVPRVFGNDLNNNNIAGESDDGQWIAMNYLNWMDSAAYMDWAGLRPMTELEYEKAARGPAAPIGNEYAWGTALIISSTYTLNNAGQTDESIATNYSTTAGNAIYDTSVGGDPVRVGIFATGSSNRIQSGASYWGIMELSGNLWERSVTVGDDAGRVFTGLHGNGILSSAGHATITTWPGLVSGQVTGAIGSGFRGGSGTNSATWLRVSDRRLAAAARTARGFLAGFRGARSAGCFNSAAAPTFDTTGSLSPAEVSEGELVTYKVTGSGSYLWVVPNDWTIVTGQGTNEIKVIAGATLPGTVRVADYNSCGAGEEASLEVEKTLEPYTLTLDAFFEAAAQERYAVHLNISTTRDANLLFRTRPVPGEVDRQMRFNGFFFDTRNPSGSFKEHDFEATGQPDGEFQATIRDVPNDHTRIVFEMIADFFPNGSTTFQFELEVYDIDRQEIIFSQILQEEYMDF